MEDFWSSIYHMNMDDVLLMSGMWYGAAYEWFTNNGESKFKWFYRNIYTKMVNFNYIESE